MTTPSAPNIIKFSDIENEFGLNPDRKLGAYRINQFIGDRYWSLDSGIPLPGNTISFGDMRGKTINSVVDYPPGNDLTRVNSAVYYKGNAVSVGNFRIPPAVDSGQSVKVFHLIRRKIGATDNSNAAALKTGDWNDNCVLEYIVTNTGKLYGRGGIPSTDNVNGSPAFGSSENCKITIESGGQVRGGGGAGGTGGNYAFTSINYKCTGTGGSGGPGRGYNRQTESLAGKASTGGPGGRCSGASCSNCGQTNSKGGAGGGGAGGEWGTNGCKGCDYSKTGTTCWSFIFWSYCESEGGGKGQSGGTAGAAVIRTSGKTVTVDAQTGSTVNGSKTAIGTFK